MRVCVRCQSSKPSTEFSTKTKTAGGKRYPDSYCRLCRREMSKEYRAKEKTK